MKNPNANSAIMSNYICKKCGWPVIEVKSYFTDEKNDDWDYFHYCSNKKCEHHEGEPIGQFSLDWELYSHDLCRYNAEEIVDIFLDLIEKK